MTSQVQWLDAELESGEAQAALMPGPSGKPFSRATSHVFRSQARGFVVTGLRLVEYEARYYADGPHAGKKKNSAEYQSIGAVRGLITARIWHAYDLLEYACAYGPAAYYPTYLYIPPRQDLWWAGGELEVSFGGYPNLGVTIAFAWKRHGAEEEACILGQKHDALADLEKKTLVPWTDSDRERVTSRNFFLTAPLIWEVVHDEFGRLRPVAMDVCLEPNPDVAAKRRAEALGVAVVLTRGLVEVRSVYDRTGEACRNSMSPPDFIRLAREYVEAQARQSFKE